MKAKLQPVVQPIFSLAGKGGADVGANGKAHTQIPAQRTQKGADKEVDHGMVCQAMNPPMRAPTAATYTNNQRYKHVRR